MSSKELIDKIIAVTEPIYGAREARAIARLYASRRSEISPSDLADLAAARPIQYVLGVADFYGFELSVGEGVLIPRPETEELVRLILDDFVKNRFSRKTRILDIGTGSGAIAIALAKNLPEARVTAIDVSPLALRYASLNNECTAAGVTLVEADILDDSFNSGPQDIIVSNPPYIPAAEQAQMHDNVTRYEPGAALFVPDDDPLVFYRAIARLARRTLTPGGALYFEIHERTANTITNLLTAEGFHEIVVREDLNSKPRMVKCVGTSTAIHRATTGQYSTSPHFEKSPSNEAER